jgi:deoxyribodipyrimidine photo-lyase
VRVVSILWYRGHDLRLADNEALCAAARLGSVIPLYVHAPGDDGDWPPGEAAAWWLHNSLAALDVQLQKRGSRLILRQAERAIDALLGVIRETGATAVFSHRRSEPAAVAVEREVAWALAQQGVRFELSDTHTLIPLGSLKTSAGNPYRVFTPFWRAMMSRGEPGETIAAPELLPVQRWPLTQELKQLAIEPTLGWIAGLRERWQPGEERATCALRSFCARVSVYEEQRNRPDLAGTSSLSAHLRFGELSPRQAWHAARGAAGLQAEPWLRQLAWRDFGHHLLQAYPQTVEHPMRPEFAAFPWRQDDTALRQWQRGETGYPLVDAGMRQLWRTGWMHNRVRMVVASFLVKDLMIAWQEGARWFWDTLVDADLANNTLGWQWAAGCGADAAPYFRVFNPVTQSIKFDPQASYIRRWIPELSTVTPPHAHQPWKAELDNGYPPPMVDHGQARHEALVAYGRMRA